jgi:hypothetical protein
VHFFPEIECQCLLQLIDWLISLNKQIFKWNNTYIIEKLPGIAKQFNQSLHTLIKTPVSSIYYLNHYFILISAGRQTIKQAKHQYRTKIELYQIGSDARQMWQGLQTMTDYKGKHSRELPSNTSLPEELNNFMLASRQVTLKHA